MLTPVTFKKHVGRYNPGETAGFLPQRAAQYIASGLAVAYQAPKKASAKAAEASEAAQALAEAQTLKAEMEARAAELDAREAALAEKEAGGAATTAKSDAGSPPAQGAKTTAKK